MKTIQKNYSSLAEMAQDLRSKSILPAWHGLAQTEYRSMDDWAGASWDEALNMLESGDLEGSRMIREAGDICLPERGSAPVARLNVRGCLPSVPNYLRGVPTNMLDIRREHNRQPVIDLYLNCALAHYIKREEAAEMARLIAGVVMRVESTGTRINIFAGMLSTKAGKKGLSLFVKIKDSEAPLNLVSVAFPMTHPAFLRQCMLGWYERNLDEYWSCYGQVQTFSEQERAGGAVPEGVKIDLQTAIEEHWHVGKISSLFNDYLESSI